MDDPDPWDALDDEADSVEEARGLSIMRIEEIQVELNGDQDQHTLDKEDDEEWQVEDEDFRLEEEFQDELQDCRCACMHWLHCKEGEKGESDEEIVPGREADLKLTDVPEDMREAVQGASSLSLKRILNEKYGSTMEATRMRQVEPEMEPERRELLDRWKLTGDPAVRYVIQTAELDDLLDVGQTNWSPNLKGAVMRNGRDPKSAAEQVNEKLLAAREQKLISRDMVNVIEAWKARHGTCGLLAVDPRFQGMENKFGAVYYNFPHAGVVQGFFDGHPFVRWRHENLMHLFFRALRGFVKKGGIVKVASNACATGVRFSDIVIGAQKSEFVHVETFPFLEWQPRGRKLCRIKPSGDMVPKATIRYPPSKDQLIGAREGRLQKMSRALAATAFRWIPTFLHTHIIYIYTCMIFIYIYICVCVIY
eukprot:Skav234356  [mRNA]  locus=scaffold1274:120726:138690:+ [translate_table: standard]